MDLEKLNNDIKGKIIKEIKYSEGYNGSDFTLIFTDNSVLNSSTMFNKSNIEFEYNDSLVIGNIEQKEFTKDMLEDFMVVETNEEENNRYMKIKNKLVQTKSFNNLNDYNNNLKYNNTISEKDVTYDIQKIYKIKKIFGFNYMLTDDSNLELIWERKEEPPVEYTLEELEQKLGQKIKIVNK